MAKMHYSHELSLTRIEQIVGVFVLIPVVVLGIILFVIARGESLFAMKYEIRTNLSQAYGIQPGTAVFVRGIQIGKVKQLLFNDRGTVEIRLQILEKFREEVRKDSLVVVSKSAVIFGETSIAIEGGTTTAPEVPPDGFIVAIEPADPKEFLAGIKPLVEQATQTLVQVQQMSEDVNEINTTIGSLRNTLSHLEEATAKLPSLLDDMKQVTALAYQTVEEMPKIAATAKNIVIDMDEITEEIKSSAHALPPIMTMVHGVVDDIRVVTKGLRDLDHDIPYIANAAKRTLDDVQVILKGAKKTFPISTMVKRGQPMPIRNRARSLRIDQLNRSAEPTEPSGDLSLSYD